MENKITAWITKNKDENPCIFLDKPEKDKVLGIAGLMESLL